MKLSQLCLYLGLAYALPNIFGILQPKKFGAVLRQFPRNVPAGIALMLAGTAWFEWILMNERLADIASWKPVLQALFLFAGVGSCFVMQDLLAVRGLAVVMMLGASAMLDIQRWHPSPLKNVITLWAYVLASAGMWFVVSPWRLRDWIQWNTATESRLRIASLLRAAFGLGVAALGLTVLK